MIAYVIVATILLGGCFVGYLYERSRKDTLTEDLREAESQIETLRNENMALRVTLANLDGVASGNTANALFQKYLKQFDRGKQCTILVTPEPHYYAERH